MLLRTRYPLSATHMLQNMREKRILLEPVLQSPPVSRLPGPADDAFLFPMAHRLRGKASGSKGTRCASHCLVLTGCLRERRVSWVLLQPLPVVCTWPWGMHSPACFLPCRLEEMVLTHPLEGWFTSLSVSKIEIGCYSLLRLEEGTMATSLWAASTSILYLSPCRLCYWEVPSADLFYESPSKVSWAWSMVGPSLGVTGKDAVCGAYSFFSNWINHFPLCCHSSKP